MKVQDVFIFATKIAEEVDEARDLKPGVQKIVPALMKVRIDGTRWKLGVVLEKAEE